MSSLLGRSHKGRRSGFPAAICSSYKAAPTAAVGPLDSRGFKFPAPRTVQCGQRRDRLIVTQFLVSSSGAADDLTVSMRSRQHYVFQHTILGGLVAREPMEVWPRFQPAEAVRSIRALWRQAGNLVPEQERIPFPEVHHVLTTVDAGDTKHLAIVFSFPKPWVRGEAFMGALIWRRPPTAVDWDDPDNAALHPLIYFTLEHGIWPHGASSTRMGAWRLDRNDEVEHVNFGPGPRPQVSDFLATAAAVLKVATPAAA